MVFTNKKRYKQNGFFYYFFWAIMIIVGSVIGVFMLSSFIPESLWNALRGERAQLFQNTNTNQDAPPPTPEEPELPSPMVQPASPPTPLLPPRDSATQNMILPDSAPTPPYYRYYQSIPKPYFSANAPVLVNGTLMPTGEFTNNKGTRYVAGILSFTGRFPQDFEQQFYTTNTYTTNEIVNIQMAIGWDYLPSFDKINRQYPQKTNVIVYLPKLVILDLKIQVLRASSRVSEQIRKQVSQYIQTLFERQLIPQKIINTAQQRLVTSYISKNYKSIQLIPIVNQ